MGDVGLDSLMAFELSAHAGVKVEQPFAAVGVAGQSNGRGIGRSTGPRAYQPPRRTRAGTRDPPTRARGCQPPKQPIFVCAIWRRRCWSSAHTRFEAAALTYIPEQFASQRRPRSRRTSGGAGQRAISQRHRRGPDWPRRHLHVATAGTRAVFQAGANPRFGSSRDGAGIPAGFAGHDTDGTIAGGDGIRRGAETVATGSIRVSR